MKFKPHPSQEKLHERFEYRADNISQPFIQKIRISQHIKIGDLVGGLYKGHTYYTVAIGKKNYMLHRLVWIYHYGDIPDGMQIDHIDGNPLNNQIENLRLATPSQNQQNSKIRSNNTSGIKGIRWYERSKKWKVQICINGKYKFIGYFDILEEAEAAITAARNNLHGGFARHE